MSAIRDEALARAIDRLLDVHREIGVFRRHLPISDNTPTAARIAEMRVSLERVQISLMNKLDRLKNAGELADQWEAEHARARSGIQIQPPLHKDREYTQSDE